MTIKEFLDEFAASKRFADFKRRSAMLRIIDPIDAFCPITYMYYARTGRKIFIANYKLCSSYLGLSDRDAKWIASWADEGLWASQRMEE